MRNKDNFLRVFETNESLKFVFLPIKQTLFPPYSDTVVGPCRIAFQLPNINLYAKNSVTNTAANFKPHQLQQKGDLHQTTVIYATR